ncbi:hypothetical protein RJT34_06035 [Clitoria ternatea]|uniref:Uncharacterized protein n=1 Tax=Clitoria ternatea TaxID=43366 RepID=A0AAN9K1A3_CLITE
MIVTVVRNLFIFSECRIWILVCSSMTGQRKTSIHHGLPRDPLVVLGKKSLSSLRRPYLDIGEHDRIQIHVYLLPVCGNCVYCLGSRNFTNVWR